MKKRLEVSERWRVEGESADKETHHESHIMSSRLPQVLSRPRLFLMKCIGYDVLGSEEKSDLMHPQSSTSIPSAGSPDIECAGADVQRTQVDVDSPSKSSAINRIVQSPVRFMILFILLVMITLIFVDIMSIASLVCITAMVMIVTLVWGNHWRNQLVYVPMAKDKASGYENGSAAIPGDLTPESKISNLSHFLDDLFDSIDYSLLLIFLGTFIVVANVESTGIPKEMWSKIVGKVPFRSLSSVVGISAFVLVASQLLGNVAVIQVGGMRMNYELLLLVCTDG